MRRPRAAGRGLAGVAALLLVATVAPSAGATAPVQGAPAVQGRQGAGSTAAGAPAIEPAAEALVARRILAVKVPNLSSRDFPQVGLPNADLVYTELVEGGYTRHVAVFSSSIPPKVRPLRSLRETDLQLLPQFGAIGVAFSGAAPSVRTAAAASGLTLFSEQLRSPEVYRDAPWCETVGFLYCVSLKAQQAAAHLSGPAGSDAVHSRAGLVVGPLPAGAGTGTPTTTATMRYPASIAARWDSSAGRYVVETAGLPSTGRRWNASTGTWTTTRLTASSVILQSVATSVARIAYACRPDHLGGPSVVYKSHTVGSGSAVLLRGGKAYPLTWSRSSRTGTTVYRHATAAAPELRVPAGRTWVFLLPESGSARFDGTTWTHPLPLPRSTDDVAAPTDDCAHPVVTGSRPVDGGAVVRFVDESGGLDGAAVAGAEVTLTDADGSVSRATTTAYGNVFVPASRIATGWVRVDYPGDPVHLPAYAYVLASLGTTAGGVVGDAAEFSPYLAVRQQTVSSHRALRFDVTAVGSTVPLAYVLQRRAAGSDVWQDVTPVLRIEYDPTKATPVRSVQRQNLSDRYGVYYYRTQVRDAGGGQKTSKVVRIGPAERSMRWTWSPALFAGRTVDVVPPAVEPAGELTYWSSTPEVCTVAQRRVTSLRPGTCVLRARVPLTLRALAATATISAPVLPDLVPRLSAADAGPEPGYRGSPIVVRARAWAASASGAAIPLPTGWPFWVQFRASGATTWTVVGRGRAIDPGVLRATVRATGPGSYRIATRGQHSAADAVLVHVPTTTEGVSAADAAPEPVAEGGSLVVAATVRQLWTDGVWRPALRGTAAAVQFRPSGGVWTTVARGAVGDAGAVRIVVTALGDGSWRVSCGGTAGPGDVVDVV